MPPIDKAELETRFKCHAPKGDQTGRYENLCSEALAFAQLIVELTPESREQSLSLSHLDTVVFFANAAIARRDKTQL